MLTKLGPLVKKSERDGYALGAFNVYNLETAKGVVEGGRLQKSPLIIGISESALMFGGIHAMAGLLRSLAEEAENPVALHLDHGKNLKLIQACITEGFSSVHIDASSFPLHQNIAITKKVVRYARKRGVWVQGEVGMIPGGHGQQGKRFSPLLLPDPQDVKTFVQKTGVNTIAVALGTAHGMFQGERIDFGLLVAVRKATKCPLVLHGSSGVPDSQIKRAIRDGIRIINVGTLIKETFLRILKDSLEKFPRETNIRTLLEPSMKNVQTVVEERLQLFGSIKKA